VFGTILHRMILWELTKVFLMSLIGITGILLMAGIIAEASQQGLGPGQILAAIPLLIPSTLPYTIPATTLFAACVVYGRLAADNEILAIKSAGINIFHVVTPGLVLGLAMSCVTMGLYYRIIPYAHYLLRAMVFNDAEELLYSLLKKNNYIGHSSMPYAMWVKGVQGRKLISPTFKRKDAHGQTDIVAQAKEAELKVVMAKKMVLIHMRWGVATSEDRSMAYFEDRTFEVPLPENFGPDGQQQKPRDMTWQQLLGKREELTDKVEAIATEIALQTSRLLLQDAPADLPQHVKNLRDRRKYFESQARFIDVELLMRPALGIGCFCFILIGCPVGIWISKSDYLSSFITCFMPITIVYYPLMLCGTGMAKEGRFNMFIMVWAADVVVGCVGLVLFTKLVRN
jgi:lipopolysaccharide export system permease protein